MFVLIKGLEGLNSLFSPGSMILRKPIIMSFAVAVVAILSSSQSMADEKASTSELPAALQAIGVDHANILSQDEAEKVRGELFFAYFQIDFFSADFDTRLFFLGDFNAIGITITPGGIAIGIQ